jgi:hypothetical protein
MLHTNNYLTDQYPMTNTVSCNPKLAVLLLSCIGSVFPVFAQTYNLSVPVTDSTGSNSPLEIQGDVSFHVQVFPDNVKTEWDMNISLTNTSRKPIIAYEVAIDATPDQGAGVHDLEQVDHFFRPTLSFLPGTQQFIKVPSRILQTSPRKEGAQPGESKAVLKVLFVEFDDGSTFGRSEWGISLSDTRKVTVDRIQEILNTVQISGPKALEASLAAEVATENNPAVTRALMNHLKETLTASGPDAAVSEMNAVLSTAEERKVVR